MVALTAFQMKHARPLCVLGNPVGKTGRVDTRRALRWMLMWHWDWLFTFNDLLAMSASFLFQIDIIE